MADLDHDQVDARALVAARRLRWSIIKQLGLVSPLLVPLGCSGSTPNDGDEGGVTTNPSSGDADTLDTADTLETADTLDTNESGESSDGVMETGSTEEDSSDVTDDGGKLDLPPQPECMQRWLAPEQVAEEFPSCEFGPFDPNLYVEYVEICVELGDGTTCDDICTESWCEGMEACFWGEPIESCGVFEQPGACCFVFASEPLPPVGRPFVVAGQARLAQVEGAGPDSRVAAHWLEMARGEHASVAAFARFVGLLQRQAAPARLVADAIAAAGDEARHAGHALQLASRFAGRPLMLGGLSVGGAASEDLPAALRAAVVEGCIGETLAAHEAVCLAAHASDEQVVRILREIASDEARHAALAWRFVAWALAAHPEHRPIVEAALAQADLAPDRGQSVMPEDRDRDRQLLALGCPSPSQRAQWRRVAQGELIRPCAERLLGLGPAAAMV